MRAFNKLSNRDVHHTLEYTLNCAASMQKDLTGDSRIIASKLFTLLEQLEKLMLAHDQNKQDLEIKIASLKDNFQKIGENFIKPEPKPGGGGCAIN